MSNPIKNLVDRLMFRGLESFGRHYSVYRGFVLSNTDTKSLNRLFVYVPHVSGLNRQGNWAFPKGVPNELSVLPKVGDMVWVEFQYGDYRYPIWSYANQQKEVRSKTNPSPRPGDIKWKSESGHQLWIHEEEDFVELTHKNGSSVTIKSDEIQIKSTGKILIKNEDEDLKSILNELIEQIQNLTIQTGMGPALPSPDVIANLNQINNKLNQLLS